MIKIDLAKINKKTHKRVKELNEIMEMLGLTEEDIFNLIRLLKNYDKILERIDVLSKDQALINDKLTQKGKVVDKDLNDITKQLFKDLNTPPKGTIYEQK